MTIISEQVQRIAPASGAAQDAVPDFAAPLREQYRQVVAWRGRSLAALGAFLLGQGLAKYKLAERVETVSKLPLTNIEMSLFSRSCRLRCRMRHDCENPVLACVDQGRGAYMMTVTPSRHMTAPMMS